MAPEYVSSRPFFSCFFDQMIFDASLAAQLDV
jgi:hypothetical protein